MKTSNYSTSDKKIIILLSDMKKDNKNDKQMNLRINSFVSLIDNTYNKLYNDVNAPRQPDAQYGCFCGLSKEKNVKLIEKNNECIYDEQRRNIHIFGAVLITLIVSFFVCYSLCYST